jgi:AmmeMemoRadiSam system protein A
MPLSSDDRETLAKLARQAVEAEVTGLAPPQLDDLSGVLGEQRGCFVTLTNQGRLRGCIGTFRPSGPLGRVIIDVARSAVRDPRFVSEPVTPAELPALDVEVSVLTPLTRTDEPEQLEVGRHGIYVASGGRAGCFLPEVATDQGWNPEQFLDYCCTHKAGLPPGAWRNPQTDVFLFESEKFGG